MSHMPLPIVQLTVDPKYDRQLPLLFHGPVLLELANTGKARLVQYLIEHVQQLIVKASITYSEFYEACHGIMWKRYRSEYVYKNAIASKILLGRHSIDTTQFFTEFRAEQCKADVVLINGTSTVYEIKTELDSLDRLNGQLLSYSHVFDRIYVVTHETYAQKLMESTADIVGILVLSDEGSFREIRKSKSNKASVLPAAIFDSLRRDEYIQILTTVFGGVPDVPNTQIYSVCKNLFAQLSPEVAHDGLVKALHRRKPSEALKHLVTNGPKSLRAAFLSADLSDRQIANLSQTLAMPVT